MRPSSSTNAICAFLAAAFAAMSIYTARAADRPLDSDLQSGDLLWPKRPGALVPYTSASADAEDDLSAQWTREKEAYLAELSVRPELTADEKAQYSTLKSMTYEEFVESYLGGFEGASTIPYGSSVLYVGHVAIVDVVDGVPYVIEAVSPTVRRITYQAWLQQRVGNLVWQGRLLGLTPMQRAQVASVATRYLGKDYKFWNFDLSAERGFYCSKLAWLAIREATGIAVDDNPRPKRSFWYSPKRLMLSPHIELLNNPGNYSIR